MKWFGFRGIGLLGALLLGVTACEEKSSTSADSQVPEALSDEHRMPGDVAKRPGHEMTSGTPTATPSATP
jgi:hypothetical protein